MKANKKISLCILAFLCTFLYSFAGVAESQEQFGVILIAHGSEDSDWNQKVVELQEKLVPAGSKSSESMEIAFLGHGQERTMKNALKKFIKKGSNNIVLIHLSPCSYIRHEEIKTLAKEKGGELEKAAFKFTLAPAMDDHPLALEIIKEHAKALSRDPGRENLILLAAGPVEELENITWMRQLERMGKTICSEIGFKEVVCATIRNHSPDLIAEQSIIDLRMKAKALKEKGRVVVVPYLFKDGPYEDLQSYLKGIVPPEDIGAVGCISHPNMETWIKEVIKKGMDQPRVKPVNKNWSNKGGERSHF